MELVQPDLSVLIIIFLTWSLYFILKRSFFDPINKVLENRDLAINGVQRQASDKLQEFEKKSRLYQDNLHVGRLEIYSQQDILRAEALNQRSRIVAEGRQQAEALIQSTKNDLQGQVVSAKRKLESDSTQIADGIVKAILR